MTLRVLFMDREGDAAIELSLCSMDAAHSAMAQAVVTIAQNVYVPSQLTPIMTLAWKNYHIL